MGWRRANEVLGGGTVRLPVLPSLVVTGQSVGAVLGRDPDIPARVFERAACRGATSGLIV